MLQPQSASEDLVRMLPASAQIHHRPFGAGSADHSLTQIGTAGLGDIQYQLAQLPTSDE